MAFQFRGEQTCSRCGHRYEWITTQVEENEVVTGSMDKMWKNVKSCTFIKQINRYSIEIECPKCWKRELVEKKDLRFN